MPTIMNVDQVVKNVTRFLVGMALLAGACAAWPAVAARAIGQAKPRKPAAAPVAAAPSKAASLAQVTGITDRVVDHLNIAGDRFFHQGDYNRVVGLMRLAVEADPAFIDGWANASYLLWSLGDNEAADALLAQGIARNPGRWELHHEFGSLLFRRKRYAEARPHLEAAVRFPNAPSQPWKDLAHCYDQMGRFEDSLKTWRVVVERYPRDVAGPTNLRRLEAKVRAASPAPRS